MTDQEFEKLQAIEDNTWSLSDDKVRAEKAMREGARYPLLAKQMGLIGPYRCIDTSGMEVWDIGCGPINGGVSSVIRCKKRLSIDPNKEAYSKYYNVQGYDGTKAEDLKERLSIPDLVISTNCIDHFQDPIGYLQDIDKYMRYGTYFCHHHAQDNAINHKHEAHVFNLNEEIVDSIFHDNWEKVWYMNYKEDGLVYSWLKEPAFCAIYRKVVK